MPNNRICDNFVESQIGGLLLAGRSKGMPNGRMFDSCLRILWNPESVDFIGVATDRPKIKWSRDKVEIKWRCSRDKVEIK